MQALAADNLVHFDLKCDNIMLEALPGHSEAEVWSCSPHKSPPFNCLLGDFGVSRQYASAAQAFTVRCLHTLMQVLHSVLSIFNSCLHNFGMFMYHQLLSPKAGSEECAPQTLCRLIAMVRLASYCI